MARYGGRTAADVQAALSPSDFDNEREANKGPVRTLEDMSADERRVIEHHYGVQICDTLNRRKP